MLDKLKSEKSLLVEALKDLSNELKILAKKKKQLESKFGSLKKQSSQTADFER